MAIDLVARLRLQDELTKPLKKVMSQLNSASNQSNKMAKATDSLGKSTSKAGNTVNKLGNAFKNASSKAGGLASSMSKIKDSSASLNGIKNAILGIAGAYLSAQGAAKLFNATVGAAARYQQSEVAVRAIFNDDAAAKAYLEMVELKAIDSPLLNSTEMLGASKSLVAMTKNVDELAEAWSIIERLMVLDPTQGTEGAAFALKEMWQGDAMSMIERFGLDRGALNEIKKMSIPQQIAEINKLLDGMGITQETVNAMGSTTLGYWAQINERVEKFMRMIGDSSNTKLGAILGGIVDKLDSMDLDTLAKEIDGMLAGVVSKAIEFAEWLWKWREPIIQVAKVLGVFFGALAGVLAISGTITAISSAITFLASPIGYIVLAITGLVIGFKLLYDHSERFRTAISNIIDRTKELWQIFKEGGVSGLLEALIPADILSALQERFTTVKEQFMNVFKGIYNAVVPILQTAWSLVSPILSALGNALKIVADVAMIAWNNILAPTVQYVMTVIQTMWKIVGPIFELLGAVIEAAFAVLRIAWDTIIGPFVAFLAGAFTQAFGAATEIVEALSPVFETLGGWIKKAADYLSMFADWLGKIKVPDWIGNLSGGAVSWAKKLIPGNYHGLDSVPYDGYVTRLHKNEMVLNAQEAKAYREGRGGGMSAPVINIANMNVRKESDIDEIAYKLAKLIERERG